MTAAARGALNATTPSGGNVGINAIAPARR
jgi:hypothetical protein